MYYFPQEGYLPGNSPPLPADSFSVPIGMLFNGVVFLSLSALHCNTAAVASMCDVCSTRCQPESSWTSSLVSSNL